jgi:hypothetical protein
MELVLIIVTAVIVVATVLIIRSSMNESKIEPRPPLVEPEDEEYTPPANATYDEPVKFTKTNQYGCGPKDEDDVYTVEEFKQHAKDQAFIDYDGFGHPVKDKLANTFIYIRPSKLHMIPKDATHIVWYNR